MGVPIILGFLGLLSFGGAIAYINFVVYNAGRRGDLLGGMVFFFMLLLAGFVLLLISFSMYRKRRSHSAHGRRR